MSRLRQQSNEATVQGNTLLDSILQTFHGWTPDEAVQSLLGQHHGAPEHVLVSAATALCMLNRDGSEPNRAWITGLLDAIAAQKYPHAEQVLFQIARDGRNTRIRMEAARRLGCVAISRDSRALLHEFARQGFRAVTSYQHDTIATVNIRQAALESLARLPAAGKDDIQCLIEVAGGEAQSAEPDAVFYAAVEALFSVAKPRDIGALVALADNCHSHLSRLAVLGVLSRFTAPALRKQRRDIVKLLIDSLGAFRRDDELRDRLANLAAKITSPELLRGITERYSGLHLGSENGLIAAAALKQYVKCDEALMGACLSLARQQENTARPDNECICGLARCAAAGHGQTICRHLVRTNVAGYEQLLRHGMLIHVMGNAKGVIEGISTALTALENDNERRQLASLCCESLVRIPLAKVQDPPRFADLEALRTGRDRYAGNGRQQMTAIVELLRTARANEDTLAALVRVLVTSKPSAGAVAIAAVLLKHDDELATLLLARLFPITRKVPLKAGEPLPSDMPMSQLEPAILPTHQIWCRENLKTMLVADGSVNRYVLDFVRRNNMEFVPACQRCLSEVRTVEDAIFALESICIRNDVDALKAVASQIGFVSTERKIDGTVRKHAISLALRLMESVKTDDKVVEHVFAQVHARFQDSTEVRLAAYDFCGSLASPRSIRPLKDRVKTDTNPAARTALAAALDAIRKNLATSPLDFRDAKACGSWLRSVADLGDPSLLEAVARFLSPPHSDAEVLVAAVKAIEAMHDKRGIPVIDAFLECTSPGGDVLRAARHTRATLQDRKDVDLLDALAEVFPPESPVLDPSVNYTDMLGQARVTRIAAGLRKALDLRNDGHWDEAVTKLDGVCDVLCRAVFELHAELLGMDPSKAQALAEKQYASRLGLSEFKKSFPSVQPIFAFIHTMRQGGSAAHLEENDGSGKPGLGEQEAERVFVEFKAILPDYLGIMRRAK